MGITTVPDLKDGDLVECIVHADAGVTHACNTAVIFHSGSQYTATFTCHGTTLDYSCNMNWSFNNLSNIIN